MSVSEKLKVRVRRPVACVALTAGLASLAVAASPAANADPVSYQLAKISNYTGYAFTLEKVERCIDDGEGDQSGCVSTAGPNVLAAPQTIAPGQTVSWDASGAAPYNAYTWTWAMTDPVTGAKHEASYYEYGRMSGMGPRGATDALFRTDWDPEVNTPHFDILPQQPTTITIDNNVDPVEAAAVLNNAFPRAVDGSVSWTPNDGATPSFTVTDPERATSMVSNYSSEPATVAKGQETSKGESTSLGLDVTASVSTDVFGVAAKAAVSVTGDTEWGSSDSVDVDVDSEVDPGHVGWIDKAVTVASLTGHLTFTTPEGVTYDLRNVTISKGDLANPHGNVPTGLTYLPDQQAITGPAGK